MAMIKGLNLIWGKNVADLLLEPASSATIRRFFTDCAIGGVQIFVNSNWNLSSIEVLTDFWATLSPPAIGGLCIAPLFADNVRIIGDLHLVPGEGPNWMTQSSSIYVLSASHWDQWSQIGAPFSQLGAGMGLVVARSSLGHGLKVFRYTPSSLSEIIGEGLIDWKLSLAEAERQTIESIRSIFYEQALVPRGPPIQWYSGVAMFQFDWQLSPFIVLDGESCHDYLEELVETFLDIIRLKHIKMRLFIFIPSYGENLLNRLTGVIRDSRGQFDVVCVLTNSTQGTYALLRRAIGVVAMHNVVFSSVSLLDLCEHADSKFILIDRSTIDTVISSFRCAIVQFSSAGPVRPASVVRPELAKPFRPGLDQLISFIDGGN